MLSKDIRTRLKKTKEVKQRKMKLFKRFKLPKQKRYGILIKTKIGEKSRRN